MRLRHPFTKPESGGRPIIVVTIAALAVRLTYALLFSMRQQLRGDELYYSAQAHMNAKGHWFEQAFAIGMPAADHPPLAVLIFTPAAWLFHSGAFIGAQRITNILLGTALVPLMAALGSKLAGRRVGLIAALLIAVSVNFTMNDTLVLSETSACVCLAAALLFALRGLSADTVRESRRSTIGMGTALSLGALARPELMLLVPLLGVTIAWRSGARVRAGKSLAVLNCALLGTCVAVLIGPWVLWNQARFDESVTLSTNDGFTLAGANCPETYFGSNLGGYSIRCAFAVQVPPDRDASVASMLQRDAAVSYAKANKGRLPLVAAMRLARVWNLDKLARSASEGPGEGRTVWGYWAGLAQFWLLVPFAVAGLRSVSKTARRVLLSVPVVVSVVAVAIHPLWRLRVLADVVLIIAAAVGLALFSPEALRQLVTRARLPHPDKS